MSLKMLPKNSVYVFLDQFSFVMFSIIVLTIFPNLTMSPNIFFRRPLIKEINYAAFLLKFI